MYVNICANTTVKSVDLIDYLDKEKSLSSGYAQYLTKESDKFFTTNNDRVEKEDVINSIDKNCKHLSKKESRFFSMTINPSKREIAHMKLIAMQTVDNMLLVDKDNLLKDMSRYELEEKIIKSLLEQYTINCMDNYALNFNREGINSNADLVWFGKVEKDRYYKASNNKYVQHNMLVFKEMDQIFERSSTPKTRNEYNEHKRAIVLKVLAENKHKELDYKHIPQYEAVIKDFEQVTNRDSNKNKRKKIFELQQSLVKESDILPNGRNEYLKDMMPKIGDNYHIHIIVSRNDKTQTKRLSPLATARENHDHNLNGKKCTIGFDRCAYTNKIESLFDKDFAYSRNYTESFNYYNERKKEVKNTLNIHNKMDMSSVDLENYKPNSNIELVQDIEQCALPLTKSEIYYLDNHPLVAELYSNNENKDIVCNLLKCDDLMKSNQNLQNFISDFEQKNQIDNSRYKYLNWNKIKNDNISIESIKKAFQSTNMITNDVISEFEFSNYVRLSPVEKNLILKLPINEIHSFSGSWNIGDYINEKLISAQSERVKEFYSFYGKPIGYNPYTNDKLKLFESKLSSFDKETLKSIALLRSSVQPRKVDYYSILLNDMYRDGKIFVSESELTNGSNYRMLRTKKIPLLSTEDHNIIYEIAKATSRNQDDKNMILNSALYIEKKYYQQGKINVPNISNIDVSKLDTEKYIPTKIRLLSEADYEIIDSYANNRTLAICDKKSDEFKQKVKSYITQIESGYYNSGILFFSDNFSVPNDARFRVNSYKFLNQEDLENIKRIAHCKIQTKYENIKVDRKVLCREIEGEIYSIEQMYYAKGTIYVPQHKDLEDITFDSNKFKKLNKRVANNIDYGRMESLANKIYTTTSEIENEVKRQFKEYYINNIDPIRLTKKDHIILGEYARSYVENKYYEKATSWKEKEIEKMIGSLNAEYCKYGVVEIAELQYSERIDSSKFVLDGKEFLTKDDYQLLYTIAEENLKKLHDTLIVPIPYVEKEVRSLEQQYNVAGKIFVTAEHKSLVANNDKFEVSQFNMLTIEQQNYIRELVKIKVDIRELKISQIDIEKVYNKEFYISTMDYYRDGNINIPKDVSLGDSNIFKVTNVNLLNNGDYNNLTIAAQIKVDILHPNIGVEDRGNLISREVARLERQYYYGRTVILPNSDTYSLFNNDNIQIFTGENLTVEDYSNLTIAAQIKVDALHPNIDVEERDNLIAREIARLEGQYYYGTTVILPNSRLYSELNNNKLQVYKGRNLTTQDYSNLLIAAQIKVDALHPNIGMEDRDKFIATEMARLEGQFYNLKTYKTQHSFLGIDTHTDVKNSQLMLPISNSYNNLRNEFVALYKPLTDKDIEVLKRFASDKQKLLNITNEKYVDNELSRLQYRYENKGNIQLPLEYNINNGKMMSEFSALQNKHYSVMYSVASARAKEQINMSPLMDIKDRNLFIQNFIEKDIARMEGQYYERGRIYIPKGNYKNLDGIFTTERTSFDNLKANVNYMAMAACRNYLLADLPEYRETYKTYKFGRRSYNVYKISRSKAKEKLAKAMVGRLSKQILTTTLIRGISKSLPIINTISLAIDAIELFKGYNNNIERTH